MQVGVKLRLGVVQSMMEIIRRIYCFTAVDSSNVVDIKINGRGYCVHGSHSFSDYADQTYGLLAGSHCPIDFDGVTATVQVWSDDDSNSEDFSCWR